MKKIFSIILFVILCSNLIAQSNSIGVFGGLNVSNANVSVTKTENPDGNIGFNRKSLIGFVGGLKYQRVFNIPFVLDVEMIMNQLGYQVHYDKIELNEHVVVVNQVDKEIIRYNYIDTHIVWIQSWRSFFNHTQNRFSTVIFNKWNNQVKCCQ